ncbi:ABC transporter permease [Thiotrichales bacterium 19S9-12]|nr:ABC transporter permease [Thiotrichales bacterium 19S9-11]MCF6811051.1 ABC transporter permease [Thiotrichales bacterium 19S9-12]
MKFEFLITDLLLWSLVILSITLGIIYRKTPYARQVFSHIKSSRLGIVCGLILLTYLIIALTDSIHFRRMIITDDGQSQLKPYSESLLDVLLSPWHRASEKTYAGPLSSTLYVKSSIVDSKGNVSRYYPKLTQLKPLPHMAYTKNINMLLLILKGFLKAVILMTSLILLWFAYFRIRYKLSYRKLLIYVAKGYFDTKWLVFWLVSFIILMLILISLELLPYFHLFGTDKVGNDVFYMALKSIRTAVAIGTLTTLVLLPLAICFGLLSGYFGGVIDDIIQYVYTTLNSIPGILLIASFSLLLSVIMSKYGDYFSSNIKRSDFRLLGLCFILGITSWSGLCRLLRAETLKVKQLDYIMAAKTLGSSHFRILKQHILPNVFYLILISIVLDFSGLVLAETILSYVGIGVDPTMASWGNMINSARLELAREPIIWWPLLAAFVLMFILVLAANLFADVVRDALDPKLN